MADDRVGYFVTAHKDFSDDALPSPIVRYIDRRDLANGPIVYYLTDEIPVQYRPVVRAAILEWNRAFAKIGIPHAIEVRDQPHEPNWDPDDIRYNTVRWITSDRENFAAYGPFIVNPLTGEIIRSELVIDGEALRSIKRGYVDTIVPALQTSVNSSAGEGAYRFESAQLAAAGSLALRIGGAPRSRIDRYADDWLRATVLHEVGHTFGLRHNFAGSALYSPAELRNPQFTARHGISSSVMDYLPANLMPPGTDHETFFQTELGPYDLWAIRYGYERFPKARSITAERAQLDEIADLSVRPEYRYGTDDDAFGADGFDPRIAPFDLSNDPLTFDAGQFAIARDLAARLDRTYPTTGEPYDRERAAFIAILTLYERATLLSARYVGGAYTSRDHRGQAGGEPPFRAIPRSVQERAFGLLAKNVFGRDALVFPPGLLADLAASREPPFAGGPSPRLDFPITQVVAGLQDQVTDALFAPANLRRIVDTTLKVGDPSKTVSLADLFGWMQAAVFDVLAPPAPSAGDALHRSLQRRYLNLLAAIALAPPGVLDRLGYPIESVVLARYELTALVPRLDQALARHDLDDAVRAHLEYLRTRVRQALAAQSIQG